MHHVNVSVPYWGSLSSNSLYLPAWCIAAYVSVPYWGSLSSNLKARAVLCDDFVSVPYWGSLSSNEYKENALKEFAEFPSPTGVLYLLIEVIDMINFKGMQVSVPYWGSLSSNSCTR